MNKDGVIIVIEDDIDDQDILSMVFKELSYKNEVMFFANGETALAYLKQSDVHPFLILSDVNMPKIDGFELRRLVHTSEGLTEKCIPYLFFTTAASSKVVTDAYALSVQGFFVKPAVYSKLVNTIRLIVEYWKECCSPNNYEAEAIPTSAQNL